MTRHFKLNTSVYDMLLINSLFYRVSLKTLDPPTVDVQTQALTLFKISRNIIQRHAPRMMGIYNPILNGRQSTNSYD